MLLPALVRTRGASRRGGDEPLSLELELGHRPGKAALRLLGGNEPPGVPVRQKRADPVAPPVMPPA